MSSQRSACPRCGAQPIFVDSRKRIRHPLHYCESCGWNISRVQDRIAGISRGLYVIFPFLLLVSFLFGITASSSRKSVLQSAAILIVFWTSVCLAGVWKQRSLRRRLARISAETSAHRQSESRRTDASLLQEFDRVRSLSIPRRVRLDVLSRGMLWLSMVFPALTCWWGLHDVLLPHRPFGIAHGTTEARIGGVIILLFGMLLTFLLPRALENRRDRELLEKGEVTIGYVVGCRSLLLSGAGVLFEFRDFQGQLVEGQCRGDLDEDDGVLIFYNRENPKNNVAMCGANYEFVKT